MSTFSGLFEEFPFISADRFDGDNLLSKVFFLSHCHTDHMVGLAEGKGLPGPLYTSAVSEVFLRQQYRDLQDIRVLEVDCPQEINYEVDGEWYHLTVTAIPARHCPGSIMLLIQSAENNVLYTGDFRLLRKDFEPCLVSLKGLTIDTVYLDSTFLDEAYKEFPSQSESITEICRLITDWLSKKPTGRIQIKTPARYGSEFIFMEIGRTLKLKIFVDNDQYEKYAHFPDMDHCISNRWEECKVVFTIRHRSEDPNLVRTIQPSALYWSHWTSRRPAYKDDGRNSFRVAYSSHSSLKELKEFLKFVRPKRVRFNVVKNKESKRRMEEIVDGILEATVEEREERAVVGCSFNNLLLMQKSTTAEGGGRQPIKLPIKRMKF